MRNYKIKSVKFTPTPENWAKYKDKQDAVFHLGEPTMILGYYTIELDNGTKHNINAGVRAVGECSMYDASGELDNIYEDDIVEIAKTDNGLAAMVNEQGWEWQNNPWYVFDFFGNNMDITPEYMGEAEVVFDYDEATDTLTKWADEACYNMFYDTLDKIA